MGTGELLRGLTGDAPLNEALATVLDALPDGIVVCDMDGVIRQVSGPLEELAGYGGDELVGQPVEVLVPTSVRVLHEEMRAAFVTSPRARSMGAGLPIDLRHRSGQLIPVEISLNPVTVAGVSHVVAAVRHAGARREAEDLLRESLERKNEAIDTLRQVDHLRQVFVRAICHDLRTPLATLRGAAETLQLRRGELDEEGTRQLVEAIVRGGDRLDRLLRDILDLDRLHRGSVGAERVDVDVVTVVREQLEELNGASEVQLDAPDELRWHVDPAQVRRIVDNLVSNAWKHAPSDRPVQVRIAQEGRELLLAVEDRGPGVSEELRERVFEPFARGDSDAPGTGVGLSLVAEFARLHGGRAWVEDRPGGGASFRVAFPGVSSVAGGADDHAPSVSRAGRG